MGVLVVMGLTAALVLPSLALPRPERETLEGVVEAARATAIARSQVLALRVDRDGAWVLAGAPAGVVIREGRLPQPLGSAMAMQLSPLGACTPDGPALQAWDPVHCTAIAGTPVPRSP